MAEKYVAVTAGDFILKDGMNAAIHGLRVAYLKMLERAGAIPIVLDNSEREKVLLSYADKFDALLLTGGGDIHPRRYKHTQHELTGKLGMDLDEARDEAEIILVQEFYKRGKPILGICRGVQMLNVVFGGDLIQDVTQEISELTETHLNPPKKGGWGVAVHEVVLQENSKLRSILGVESLPVNSMHHQAIQRPGEGLIVVGKSRHGIVEAIEHSSEQFVMGVQWHPEQLPDDPYGRKLFDAFVGAI